MRMPSVALDTVIENAVMINAKFGILKAAVL